MFNDWDLHCIHTFTSQWGLFGKPAQDVDPWFFQSMIQLLPFLQILEVDNKRLTQNMSIIAEFDFNDMTCIIYIITVLIHSFKFTSPRLAFPWPGKNVVLPDGSSASAASLRPAATTVPRRLDVRWTSREMWRRGVLFWGDENGCSLTWLWLLQDYLVGKIECI